ncbi:MAG: hypothetical protein QOJ00_978 [Actinomycetota bacterium]|jgi:hypothetical protein
MPVFVSFALVGLIAIAGALVEVWLLRSLRLETRGAGYVTAVLNGGLVITSAVAVAIARGVTDRAEAILVSAPILLAPLLAMIHRAHFSGGRRPSP